MNRRTFLTTLLASGAIPRSALGEPLPSLRDLGADKGIEIGAAFEPAASVSESALVDLVRTQCSLITQEYSLKRDYVCGPDEWNAHHAFQAFADAHNLQTHGHLLYWPKDDRERSLRETLAEKQRRYGAIFETLVARAPNMTSWDVLNEVAEDAALRGFRQPTIKDYTLAPEDRLDFLVFCLKTARALCGPSVRLVLNDYNLYCPGSVCGDKRENVLATVRALMDQGAPLNAVALQSHLSSSVPQEFDEAAAFIEAVGALGLKVHSSELDMKSHAFKGADQDARDQEHKAYVYEYLSTVLAFLHVERITFWRLADAGHELHVHTGGACTTECSRPTLFDENFQKKDAFDAVVDALNEAPRRPGAVPLERTKVPQDVPFPC